MKKFIVGGWIISLVSLLFYSYTQIDLSLTLSQASLWQVIQKQFQYVGWFNRPLSFFLYIGVLTLLYGFYLGILWLVKNKNLSRKEVYILIFLTVGILFFSYNAFSYDLFNYIFDAKIITHYSQNPYLHKALDFPNDPMLSFMRWTHRTYPYGPGWLLLTVPLSFLGAGYFIVTFFLFKLLAVIAFLLTCFYLEKANKEYFNDVKKALFSLAFFACNPLVIIESLVSAHIDITMMTFAILGFYFFLKRKYLFSIIILLFSASIKFASGFLLPLFIFPFLPEKRKLSSSHLLTLATTFLTIAVIASSLYSGNYQPWYLLSVIPFAAFFSRKNIVLIPTTIISLFSLLEYAPYIYLGNWDKPVPEVLFALTASSVGLSLLVVCSLFFLRGKKAFS